MRIFDFFQKKNNLQIPQSPLTLQDAATEVQDVEICPSVKGLFLGNGILADASQSLFWGWKSDAFCVRQYRLKDVVLDRSLMVFLKNGRPIVDTSYLQPPDAVAALTVRANDLVEAPSGQQEVAACFDHWDSNYYHWLVHTVPTLHSLRRQGFAGGLILPGLAQWQSDTIRLSGLDPDRSVTTHHGKQYAFRSVIYTDFVRGKADFVASCLSVQAYRTLVNCAGTDDSSDQHLRIFIARGDASNRAVTNEAELASALEKLGFLVVYPEKFTIEQQINLFQKARFVVGALGAGMANLAWCRPGTGVCELVPEHHQNPCTLALATQMGLPYWGELVPTGLMTENHTSASLISYDVSRLTNRVAQLIAL